MSYQQPPNYPQGYPQQPNTRYQPWQGQPGFQQTQPPQPMPPPNFQSYPPQQPPMMPPPPPPKKKRNPLVVFLLCFVGVLLVCGAIGALSKGTQAPNTSQTASSSPAATDTPTPKPTPTHALKWTTSHAFTGTGEKTTPTFQTSGDWRLVWTAQASSDSDAFFGATVYGSDGSSVDSGITATIPAGKKQSDSTEEHTGAGSFYVKVFAGVPWTVSVQEMK